MALFFDSAWFDARLAQAGLKKSDVATALGLSEVQINELWKDQRELKANDVRLLAALLGVEPREIASRAGISTPIPKDAPFDPHAFDERLARIEVELAEIKALIARKLP